MTVKLIMIKLIFYYSIPYFVDIPKKKPNKEKVGEKTIRIYFIKTRKKNQRMMLMPKLMKQT